MRRLVICADGTWDHPDLASPSNVAKLARGILPVVSGTSQIVYYHSGVGTGWDVIDRFVGGATGRGLDENVKDAYRFLVNNYADGDEVYLFGFSRGAYTVRSVAGFVRKCGLLRKDSDGLVANAYVLYRRDDVKPDDAESVAFRKNFAREIRVKFIGVWDTVGALGIPALPYLKLVQSEHEFHDVALSRIVDFAYHALAIDELRVAFKPTLWEQNPDHGDQVMEQRWFPGAHANIGGGFSSSGLSDLALTWMKQRAEATGLGFDEDYLRTRVRADAEGEMNHSRSFLYRLWKPYFRPIKQPTEVRPAVNPGGTSNEVVDQSSLDRRTALDVYRPSNLEDYLRLEHLI